MKKIEVVISEKGIALHNPNDGFIVYGDIYKADDESRLIGGSIKDHASQFDIHVSASAYSVFEFLDVLHIPIEVISAYVDSKKPIPRTEVKQNLTVLGGRCPQDTTDYFKHMEHPCGL
jgi:hypothetical protein